jgi:hypothetical protein
MKLLLLLLLSIGAAGVAPATSTQEHGQVGYFADYLRLSQANDTNMVGLGGRLGYRCRQHTLRNESAAREC